MENKPLFIPLKAIYFDQFASGEKKIEYRIYGSRWNESTCKIGRSVVLSRGYGKKHRVNGIITDFDCVNSVDCCMYNELLKIYTKEQLQYNCIAEITIEVEK